jgi:hypothetical protein
MPNCPISRKDILAAEDILGPNLGSLKAKKTRTTNNHGQGEPINIPITITSCYRYVTIACDIIFVNKIPFFMAISQHIKLGTTEMTKSQKVMTLLAAIKHVKSAYMK